MNQVLAASMAEVLKIGIIGWVTYMQQHGATPEQIEAGYQAAKNAMLANDPDKIPDYRLGDLPATVWRDSQND